MELVLVDVEKELNDFLTGKGFKKEDDKWSKSVQVVAQQMIVNGQQINKTQTINYEISFLGEGSISNMDDTNTSQLFGIEVCGEPYWTGASDFMSDVKKILKDL